MKSVATQPRRPGRPLSFDREEALEKAMVQFWRTGFETTSIAVLTRAMNITPPSLYAAFGDKETLFLEAVRRYTTPGDQTAAEAIRNAPSAKEAALQLLEVSARWFTQPGLPAGCLVASAASTGSETSREVRSVLKQVRREMQDALEERVQRDKHEGKLPATANAGTLAAMTMAMVQGLSTLARDGAAREELLAIAQTAMGAWPSA